MERPRPIWDAALAISYVFLRYSLCDKANAADGTAALAAVIAGKERQIPWHVFFAKHFVDLIWLDRFPLYDVIGKPGSLHRDKIYQFLGLYVLDG